MADRKGHYDDPRLEKLMAQAHAARERAGKLKQRAEDVRAANLATRRLVADIQSRWPQSGTRGDLLRRSEFLRLVARVETMPVIEQAKGIIMMQSRCGEVEAFDLLRRASQRSNIPVRELAAHIVCAAGRSLKEPVARRDDQGRISA